MHLSGNTITLMDAPKTIAISNLQYNYLNKLTVRDIVNLPNVGDIPDDFAIDHPYVNMLSSDHKKKILYPCWEIQCIWLEEYELAEQFVDEWLSKQTLIDIHRHQCSTYAIHSGLCNSNINLIIRNHPLIYMFDQQHIDRICNEGYLVWRDKMYNYDKAKTPSAYLLALRD
jgi:hypothetical protein